MEYLKIKSYFNLTFYTKDEPQRSNFCSSYDAKIHMFLAQFQLSENADKPRRISLKICRCSSAIARQAGVSLLATYFKVFQENRDGLGNRGFGCLHKFRAVNLKEK